MFRSTVFAVSASLALTTPILAQHWDVSSGFSPTDNPSGPWAYGTRATLSGNALLIFPDAITSSGLNIWQRTATTSLGAPSVAMNRTNTTISAGTVSWPPGRVSFHPGDGGVPDAAVCIVRWTAPYAGTFGVTASFLGMDGGSTDVAVVENGAVIYSAQRAGVGGNNGDKVYSAVRALAAGATLDFAVGSAGSFFNDSTGLDVSIDRVPCNAADVAGLGGTIAPDGRLTSDDLIVFLQAFFTGNLAVADVAQLGGAPGTDGQLTADDVVYYLNRFFAPCDP